MLKGELKIDQLSGRLKPSFQITLILDWIKEICSFIYSRFYMLEANVNLWRKTPQPIDSSYLYSFYIFSDNLQYMFVYNYIIFIT